MSALTPEFGGNRGLTVVPDPLHAFARAQHMAAAIAWLDVENECPHGRLAGDPTPACGCFPQERPVRRPPASNGRVIGHVRQHGQRLQKVLCVCGRTWTRKPRRGQVPRCPTCRGD